MSVRVLDGGAMSSVQDLGRIGFASIGVGRAGAMDDVSARLANALVGNTEEAPFIEMCLRGATLQFESPCLVAITGAGIEASLRGDVAEPWRPLRIDASDTLRFGPVRRGAFAYLAIRGGVATVPVLGSASTDLNARIGANGGRVLRSGDVLAMSDSGSTFALGTPWSVDPEPWFDATADAAVHVSCGAHFSALDAASRLALFDAQFRIGAQSNRVGYRLEGHTLQIANPSDLVSEPVARGTMQLPPGGTPIALMAEHPTIGGYPRIAQVAAIDWPRLAQRPLGSNVRFREIAQDDAQSRYLRREHALERLIAQIRSRIAE